MNWIKLAQVVNSLLKTMIHRGVTYKIRECIDLMRDYELNVGTLLRETLVTRQFVCISILCQ